MRALDDREFVRDQYATEANLAARKSVYTNIEGADPRQLAFAAVAEAAPGRVVEVGGGEGELAERIVHVSDVPRAISELARVLRPGGRLVAVTNAADHLQELHDLAGTPESERDWLFRSENGEDLLRRAFTRIDRRDANGWVTMDDEALRRYAGSWEALSPILELPRQEPLRIRRRTTIFVAETAS